LMMFSCCKKELGIKRTHDEFFIVVILEHRE
jgi:hypothetical protein